MEQQRAEADVNVHSHVVVHPFNLLAMNTKIAAFVDRYISAYKRFFFLLILYVVIGSLMLPFKLFTTPSPTFFSIIEGYVIHDYTFIVIMYAIAPFVLIFYACVNMLFINRINDVTLHVISTRGSLLCLFMVAIIMAFEPNQMFTSFDIHDIRQSLQESTYNPKNIQTWEDLYVKYQCCGIDHPIDINMHNETENLYLPSCCGRRDACRAPIENSNHSFELCCYDRGCIVDIMISFYDFQESLDTFAERKRRYYALVMLATLLCAYLPNKTLNTAGEVAFVPLNEAEVNPPSDGQDESSTPD